VLGWLACGQALSLAVWLDGWLAVRLSDWMGGRVWQRLAFILDFSETVEFSESIIARNLLEK